MNAVAAWPDGNDDVIGRRIPYGSASSWVKCSWGRTRRNASLITPLVSERLGAEQRAEPQRDRRIALPRGTRRRRASSHSSPWSAALDSA